MSKYILAGVGEATAYSQGASPQKIFTAQTLQEDSMSIAVTAEDIRGGLSNKLIGKYFHDSVFDATLTDALFDLNYIALNTGGNIIVGGDSLVTESVKVVTPNEITVKGTPVAFGDAGTVGWYTIAGKEDWKPITFKGQTATVGDLASETEVCVQYNANDDALQQFTVPSSIVPSEVTMIMTYPLFAAGADVQSLSTSSQVGELIVEIPRFLFSGNMDLTLTSSGAATSNISGSALSKNTHTGCSEAGSYANIKMKIYDTKWYDGLEQMAVNDAEFTIGVGESKDLVVTGIYNGGKTGIIRAENLTCVSEAPSTASVTKATVRGVEGGKTHISIHVTDKPEIEAVATVTVE